MQSRYHSYVIGGRAGAPGSRGCSLPIRTKRRAALRPRGIDKLSEPRVEPGEPDEETDRQPHEPGSRVVEEEPGKPGSFDLDLIAVGIPARLEQRDDEKDRRDPEVDRDDLTHRPVRVHPRVDEMDEEQRGDRSQPPYRAGHRRTAGPREGPAVPGAAGRIAATPCQRSTNRSAGMRRTKLRRSIRRSRPRTSPAEAYPTTPVATA